MEGTWEDRLSLILGEAKAIRIILDDMMACAEPNRMHALQIILEHQINCCRELSEQIRNEEIV